MYCRNKICGEFFPQSHDWHRRPTKLLQLCDYRKSSHRRKDAFTHLVDMVGLYRSPISVREEGGLLLFQLKTTYLRGTYRKRGEWSVPFDSCISHCLWLCYTAKTKYRNFETNTVFPEKEYRGLSPNFHIHASVSNLYIPTIGLPVMLEEICRPILRLYKSLTDTWMWKLGLRPRYSQKRNT